MIKRLTILILAIGLSTQAYAAAPAVFSFYDDGGEHGYQEECDSGAEVLKYYNKYSKKLKQPDTSKNLLGIYSDNGNNEATVTTTFAFYSTKDSCEKGLTKARAWYDAEEAK